jgi:DNA-binding XRE family transcriptional regulator
VQYLEKNGEREYAVIPVDVYRQLLEQAEDTEDIRASDKAMRKIENGEDKIIPAEKAGVGKSYISQIETGRREGTVSVYRAIAKALQVDIDDLVES